MKDSIPGEVLPAWLRLAYLVYIFSCFCFKHSNYVQIQHFPFEWNQFSFFQRLNVTGNQGFVPLSAEKTFVNEDKQKTFVKGGKQKTTVNEGKLKTFVNGGNQKTFINEGKPKPFINGGKDLCQRRQTKALRQQRQTKDLRQRRQNRRPLSTMATEKPSSIKATKRPSSTKTIKIPLSTKEKQDPRHWRDINICSKPRHQPSYQNRGTSPRLKEGGGGKRFSLHHEKFDSKAKVTLLFYKNQTIKVVVLLRGDKSPRLDTSAIKIWQSRSLYY